MKDALETMEILTAYDLTESLRGAADLTGWSHHTVAAKIRARDAGRAPGAGVLRGRVTHVCQTTGDSVRMNQALAGKGVMPLI